MHDKSNIFKKIIFFSLMIVLSIVLFFNPNFKTIAAGVAILLFGMFFLEDGFRGLAQGPLQKLLKRATDKLYKSITLGAIVTALIQSSSLVSVITISFISAGLIDLAGGIGLIFGANIGTTATAWLVAGFGLKIKISALAMPMLIFGIIFSFQKSHLLKSLGNILAGLGFFFLGIHYMKEGFEVYKAHIDLSQYAVPGMLGVLIYTGIGIFITTILQSSSATLALILAALSTGQIEYENALALAIGANIGTTITAILGSISSNIAGKRLAAAHLIFNVVTGIVAMIIIYPLSQLVNYLAEVLGISPTDYTLKLALFHTLFNVLGVILMVPMLRRLERFLLRRFKEKPNKGIDEPKFLNPSILEMPSATIMALLDESKYLFKNAIFEIVAHALNIHRDDIKSDEKLKNVVRNSTESMDIDVEALYYLKVKKIYGEILRYATTALSKFHLSDGQIKLINEIRVANRKMVELIRNVRELRKNIDKYMHSDNEHMRRAYNKFRRKVAKVLRIIYRFRKSEDKEKYRKQLHDLKRKAANSIHSTNKSIDKLIRENLIDANMASSLVNDNDNVNNLIKKLINIAELLYAERDELWESEIPALEDIQS